ncbi:hypothetical protein HK096_001855 [Nowakowskiella sp. JEL0078]|nr:hypothetical protein HK096_001855 [Nowakowskiella sp. JEL0078]
MSHLGTKKQVWRQASTRKAIPSRDGFIDFKNRLNRWKLFDDASTFNEEFYKNAKRRGKADYVAISHCWKGDDEDDTRTSNVAKLNYVKALSLENAVWYDVEQVGDNAEPGQLMAMPYVYRNAREVHVLLNRGDSERIARVCKFALSLMEGQMNLGNDLYHINVRHGTRLWTLTEAVHARDLKIFVLENDACVERTDESAAALQILIAALRSQAKWNKGDIDHEELYALLTEVVNNYIWIGGHGLKKMKTRLWSLFRMAAVSERRDYFYATDIYSDYVNGVSVPFNLVPGGFCLDLGTTCYAIRNSMKDSRPELLFSPFSIPWRVNDGQLSFESQIIEVTGFSWMGESYDIGCILKAMLCKPELVNDGEEVITNIIATLMLGLVDPNALETSVRDMLRTAGMESAFERLISAGVNLDKTALEYVENDRAERERLVTSRGFRSALNKEVQGLHYENYAVATTTVGDTVIAVLTTGEVGEMLWQKRCYLTTFGHHTLLIDESLSHLIARCWI